MKEIALTLQEYLTLGGKIENINAAFDNYNKLAATNVAFSHTNPPSFGNPNGVDMYLVNGNTIAGTWITVYAAMKLVS